MVKLEDCNNNTPYLLTTLFNQKSCVSDTEANAKKEAIKNKYEYMTCQEYNIFKKLESSDPNKKNPTSYWFCKQQNN